MSVKIEYFDDGRIAVYSPYNKNFVDVARMYKGKWDGANARWIFARSIAEEIKKEVIDIFGENGESVHQVTVRLNVNKFIDYSTKVNVLASLNNIFLFGRYIASRDSLYSTVKLDSLTTIVNGGFKAKGGTWDSIQLAPKENTILEIKNVPIDLFTNSLNFYNLRDNNDIFFRVKKELEIPNYIESLEKEKENLLNRISKIDSILKDLKG